MTNEMTLTEAGALTIPEVINIRKQLAAALARVAELEAELAAQEWRPVTITEPSPDFTVELIVVGYRGDDGYWHYPDGPEGLVIRGWRPVPPSVALREPTP